MVKKIINGNKFIVTKRCVHCVDKLTGSCNINVARHEILNKDQANFKLKKLDIKKCDWCLSIEDIEIK